MSCAKTEDFVIWMGKSFRRVIRWESKPYLYRAITGITKAAPAVITATSHSIPDGWRVAVVSAQGMTEINALNAPPRDSEFMAARVLTSSTIALDDVDSSQFTTYSSGGYLQLFTPVDLTGMLARYKVKDKVGGTTLVSLTSSSGITISNTTKTITIDITAAATAAYTWTTGVHELEMEDSNGFVTGLFDGSVEVKREVVV